MEDSGNGTAQAIWRGRGNPIEKRFIYKAHFYTAGFNEQAAVATATVLVDEYCRCYALLPSIGTWPPNMPASRSLAGAHDGALIGRSGRPYPTSIKCYAPYYRQT